MYVNLLKSSLNGNLQKVHRRACRADELFPQRRPHLASNTQSDAFVSRPVRCSFLGSHIRRRLIRCQSLGGQPRSLARSLPGTSLCRPLHLRILETCSQIMPLHCVNTARIKSAVSCHLCFARSMPVNSNYNAGPRTDIVDIGGYRR